MSRHDILSRTYKERMNGKFLVDINILSVLAAR